MLRRNALFAGSQTIVSGLCQFIAIKLAIDACGIESLGLWGIVYSYISISRIFELGVVGALLKNGATLFAENNKNELSRLVATCMLWTIAINILIAPCIAIIIKQTSLQQRLSSSHHIVWVAICASASLSIAAVMGQALAATGRIWVRSLIGLSSSITLLYATYATVFKHDVIYYGLALVAQNTVFILISLIVLNKLSIVNIRHIRPSPSLFKGLVKYGIQFQATSTLQSLCDPVSKFYLVQFGTLHDIAIMDIATKCILFARQILVSATESIVPYFAGFHTKRQESLNDIFLRILTSTMYLSCIACFISICSAPLVSHVYINKKSDTLVFFFAILSISWFINTVSAPSYFAAQGFGRQSINLLSHLITGLLNILLGAILGNQFGAIGVILGFGIALSTGSIIGIFRFFSVYKISISDLKLPTQRLLIVPVMLALIAIPISLDAVEIHTAFSLAITSLLIGGGLLALSPVRSLLTQRKT